MKVEIISIGTELVHNDVLDVNAARATACLREVGVQVTCRVTVGDHPDLIAQTVTNGLERADVVLTMGGLGDDEDDLTRQAIRQLLHLPTTNPKDPIPGARCLDDNQPGPDGFLLPINGKTIICLPGGRRRVAYLLETAIVPFFKARQEAGVVYYRQALLHTAGLVESDIRLRLEPIKLAETDQMLLHTFAGQTDIRLSVESPSTEEADSHLAYLKEALYARLGDHVYGENETRLEQVVWNMLGQQGLSLAVAECDTRQAVYRLFLPFMAEPGRVSFLPVKNRGDVDALLTLPDGDNRLDITRWSRIVAERLREYTANHLGLLVLNQISAGGIQLLITLASPKGTSLIQRTFGGHPDNIEDWTLTLTLVLLRRWLLANHDAAARRSGFDQGKG